MESLKYHTSSLLWEVHQPGHMRIYMLSILSAGCTTECGGCRRLLTGRVTECTSGKSAKCRCRLSLSVECRVWNQVTVVPFVLNWTPVSRALPFLELHATHVSSVSSETDSQANGILNHEKVSQPAMDHFYQQKVRFSPLTAFCLLCRRNPPLPICCQTKFCRHLF